MVYFKCINKGKCKYLKQLKQKPVDCGDSWRSFIHSNVEISS